MEEKKIEFKYEINQDLVVYKDNIAYRDGAVVRVMDRSTDDPSTYLVISLQDLGAANGDVTRMYNEFSKWIHQDDCYPVSYDRIEEEVVEEGGLLFKIWRFFFG